jgi:flagellar biosynthesis component FlhA
MMKDQEILRASQLLDSLEQSIDQQQLDQYLGEVLAMDVDVQTKKRLITALVSTWQQQQQSELKQILLEIQQLRSEIRQNEELDKARDNQVLKQVSFIRRGLEFVRSIFASKN